MWIAKLELGASLALFASLASATSLSEQAVGDSHSFSYEEASPIWSYVGKGIAQEHVYIGWNALRKKYDGLWVPMLIDNAFLRKQQIKACEIAPETCEILPPSSVKSLVVDCNKRRFAVFYESDWAGEMASGDILRFEDKSEAPLWLPEPVMRVYVLTEKDKTSLFEEICER